MLGTQERRASQKAQLVEMPTSSSFDAGTPRNSTTVSAKVLIRQNLRRVLWLVFAILQTASRPVEGVSLPIVAFRTSATRGAQAPRFDSTPRSLYGTRSVRKLGTSPTPGAESLQRSPTSDSKHVGFNEASQ